MPCDKEQNEQPLQVKDQKHQGDVCDKKGVDSVPWPL